MNISSLGNLSQPFFSVVIPVYNKGPHLHRSISSVLNQNFRDFELLLINDASTDNSEEVMLKFVDARIQILKRSIPGPGGYAARNLGTKKARAKWVAFLDADDEWFPGHLNELKQLIHEFPEAGLVCTSWNEVQKDAIGVPNLFREKMGDIGKIPINYKDYIYKCVKIGFPYCSSAIAVLQSALLAVEGFPADKCRRGGDVDTWLRVMAYVRCAAWSSKISAVYFKDSVNMVTKHETFTASWEKGTIDTLLFSESDRQVRIYLKKYNNKRIIDRYLYSRLAEMRSNENLLPNIYLPNLTFKQLLIVSASPLSDKLINILNSFMRYVNHKLLRKLQSF